LNKKQKVELCPTFIQTNLSKASTVCKKVIEKLYNKLKKVVESNLPAFANE